MPTLTVRRDDAPDVSGDTVRFDGDELSVHGPCGSVTVHIDDVRSIIAGEPAGLGVAIEDSLQSYRSES